MDRNVDKLKSEKSLEMLKAGGKQGDNHGVTGSSRSYPKGGVKASADFDPRKGKRSATTWAVGGV